MSGDWVNRIGIILNFCAGFLLAPQVIGLRQLEEFVPVLNERVRRFREFIEKWRNRLNRGILFFLEGGRAMLVFVCCSLGSLALWWIFLLVVFNWFDLSVSDLPSDLPSRVAATAVILVIWLLFLPKIITRIIISILLTILFIPLQILGTVGVGLVRVGSWLLSRVLGIVIDRLECNEGLRGIVNTLGIALFIVGNTLQLGATWLMDSQN